MTHPHTFTVIRDGKKVTTCDNPVRHQPRPQRIVGHHILPKACGGLTTPENIAALDDCCHYATHLGMWTLQHAPHHFPGLRLSAFIDALARRGWREAVALGTANQLPNEGGGTG